MRTNRISVAFKVTKSKNYYELPTKVKVAFVNWIDRKFNRAGLSYLGNVIEKKCDDVDRVRESLKISRILSAAA